ncbi:MAG: hypothetical protein L0Y72_03315 [Gemmataceae bacterium]|nr:hypothetical protein [Gemmataceae bacterium]MCI0738047.1 hypothetical protein [Gemmataceae bacterium]
MRPLCISLALVLGTGQLWAQEPKPTAQQKAARRLADLLQPLAERNALSMMTGPMARLSPRDLDHPELAPPPLALVPPLLPAAPLSTVQPRHLVEGLPLAHFLASPLPPAPIELALLPLVRLPAQGAPEPLPILAQPARDRASLGDATFEFSVAAALGAVQVRRAGPLPFAPFNLPDPFEHSQAVRLRIEVAEQPLPALRQ